MKTISSGASGNFSDKSSIQNYTESCWIDDADSIINRFHIFWSTTSLIGNVLIILVVYKRKELRRTINYFIVNMAVSDFLISGLIIVMASQSLVDNSWSSYMAFGSSTGLIPCMLEVLLQAISFAVSSQSLVWIALDRFVAVVIPMKVHFISTRFRSFAIASTWVFAIVAVSPLLLFIFFEENEKTKCVLIGYPGVSRMAITYFKVYTAVFQIVPFFAVTFFYGAITLTLKRQDKVFNANKVHQHSKTKGRAIKMTLNIVAAFYIFFSPLLTASLIWEYQIVNDCSASMRLLWNASFGLMHVSWTINPVLCFTFIQSYRNGLKEVLRSWWNKSSAFLQLPQSLKGRCKGIDLNEKQTFSWNLRSQGATAFQLNYVTESSKGQVLDHCS